jgi:glycosyltransferase involved in cell wall biosynthesis
MASSSSVPTLCPSVLVCSHNPKERHFTRTLLSLRQQTLAQDLWELLLIDNASDPPLANRVDLSWHPRAQHLREEQVGKTNAFLRGLAASTGPVLVIVDDDNVLAPDYLQQAMAIGTANPNLGAWGGNVILQFEEPPPQWTRPFWTFLAEQVVTTDRMVCNVQLSQPLPVGAGCCLRRIVAERYAAHVANSPWRRSLGPTGKDLMRCEDTDLVLTAGELGLFRGVFQSLRLDHLIPPERLREDYLLRLVEGIQFSSQILEMCRETDKRPPRVNWWWWLKYYADCVTKFGRKRRFFKAYKRGQRKARAVFASGALSHK